jgi:hypothetical protein
MKRPIVLAAVSVAAALTLTGCSKSPAGAEAAVTASPIPAGEQITAGGGIVIPITITATSVTPTGGVASVGVGKPVTFKITATVAGQIHVHSTPEQHIVFPKGASKVTLTFKVPGTIEVEDHALDRQIVQIQVS